MSAKQKILSYLSKNATYNTLTPNQARAKFGIANVAARVSELRDDGHAIYMNTRTLEDGRKIQFYRLGSPTKRMVAAGISALRDAGMNTYA